MTDHNDAEPKGALPKYEAPKLTVLDMSSTKTGPSPDPNEFPGILQMS